jgi:hypothetical protein
MHPPLPIRPGRDPTKSFSAQGMWKADGCPTRIWNVIRLVLEDDSGIIHKVSLDKGEHVHPTGNLCPSGYSQKNKKTSFDPPHPPSGLVTNRKKSELGNLQKQC